MQKPKFRNQVIDLAHVKKIRSHAKAKHQSKVNLWKTISNCLTNNHYLCSDYEYGYTDYINKEAPLRSMGDTMNYNPKPHQSANNLINKIYNAVFEEGILLTLADDLSNVTGVFLHEELERDIDLKKRYEGVKKFLVNMGQRLTASINDSKTHGVRVLKAVIKDLVYFGNACFNIRTNSNKKYIWEQISLNDVSIERDADSAPVWFFITKKMNIFDIEEFFGGNEAVMNKIYTTYPEIKDRNSEVSINIEESVFYDSATNVSFIYYDLETSEETEFLYEKWSLGESYIYYSIERPLKNTYGKSIAENNLHDLIILQILTYWRSNISVKEMCPKIMKILKNGIEKEDKVDSHVAHSLSRSYSAFNTIGERLNNSKSTFDMEKLPLVEALSRIGVNALGEIRTSYPQLQTIEIINIEIARIEQQTNIAYYGSIIDQLNNSTFQTGDLKSGTYSEIAARNQQNLVLLSPYLNEYLPMMPVIYNRLSDLAFENIIKILIYYKTEFSDKEILYYNKEYYKGETPLQSLLFKLKLGYERRDAIETLAGQLEIEEYLPYREEYNKIVNLINDTTTQYQKREDEETKDQLRRTISRLQMSKELFEQDLYNNKVLPNAYFKFDDEMKQMKDENMDEYIIWYYLPENMLLYILDILNKKNSFKSSFDIDWTGSTVKRMKNLKLNALDEAIQGLVALASATEDGSLLKQIDWRLYAERRLEAAGAPELLLSKEKVKENAQAEQQQQIAMMQAQQDIQQQNNQPN